MVRNAIILAALALASCGGEEPKGAEHGNTDGAGCLQSTCEPDLDSRVQSICVQDECLPAGPAGDDYGLKRAELTIFGRMPFIARSYDLESYSLTIFHELAPDGSKLTCEKLLSLPPAERRNAGYSNLVAWTTGAVPVVNDLLSSPAHGVPVTEDGRSDVVLLEYFTGLRSQIPDGIIAQGCIEGLHVIEGAPTQPEDDRYMATVDIAMVGVAE